MTGALTPVMASQASVESWLRSQCPRQPCKGCRTVLPLLGRANHSAAPGSERWAGQEQIQGLRAALEAEESLEPKPGQHSVCSARAGHGGASSVWGRLCFGFQSGQEVREARPWGCPGIGGLEGSWERSQWGGRRWAGEVPWGQGGVGSGADLSGV